MKTLYRVVSGVIVLATLGAALLVLHGNPESVTPRFEVPYSSVDWAPGTLPLGLVVVVAFAGGLVVATLIASGTVGAFAWRARVYRRQLEHSRNAGLGGGGLGGQTILDLPEETGPMRLTTNAGAIPQVPGEPEIDRTVVSALRFPTDELELELELTG